MMLRRFWRVSIWVLGAIGVLLVLLLLPVGYVEVFCREEVGQNAYEPLIVHETFQRAEANSYLTYPEWHIVYAYEGLANVLQSRDEHEFSYTSSVWGFWKSFCALNRRAYRHGGGDFDTTATIHTIGVSFTVEMIMKAFYEETLGRLFATIRGKQKTPQDAYAADMAADYANFLQQVPWYKYDFNKSVAALWAQPLSSPVRGWERRLALGGEWKAKAGYAKLIAGAVEATGHAQLQIRTVVTGLAPIKLSSITNIKIVESTPEHVIIETPRYREFTDILRRLSQLGGRIVEIAGNDDIMVCAIEPADSVQPNIQNGEIISRIARDGFDSNRILVSVKVNRLSEFLAELDSGQRTLEHIYDY